MNLTAQFFSVYATSVLFTGAADSWGAWREGGRGGGGRDISRLFVFCSWNGRLIIVVFVFGLMMKAHYVTTASRGSVETKRKSQKTYETYREKVKEVKVNGIERKFFEQEARD